MLQINSEGMDHTYAIKNKAFPYSNSGKSLPQEQRSYEDLVDGLTNNISITVDFSGIGIQRFNSLNQREKNWIGMTIGSLVIKELESLTTPMTCIEKTREFCNVLEHALLCRYDCRNTSCRKMKMVISHYELCRKNRKEKLKEILLHGDNDVRNELKGNKKCLICLQLIKIISRHSMNDCVVPYNHSGCPLFMCDSIRKIHYLRTFAKCNLNIRI